MCIRYNVGHQWFSSFLNLVNLVYSTYRCREHGILATTNFNFQVSSTDLYEHLTNKKVTSKMQRNGESCYLELLASFTKERLKVLIIMWC